MWGDVSHVFVVFPGSLCRDGYSLVLVRTVRVWWAASDLSAVRDNWDDNAAATTDNSVWCMDITTLINNDPTTSRPQDDHTHRRLLHADTGWPRHTSRADTCQPTVTVGEPTWRPDTTHRTKYTSGRDGCRQVKTGYNTQWLSAKTRNKRHPLLIMVYFILQLQAGLMQY